MGQDDWFAEEKTFSKCGALNALEIADKLPN
jgi:hypothetical protein